MTSRRRPVNMAGAEPRGGDGEMRVAARTRHGVSSP